MNTRAILVHDITGNAVQLTLFEVHALVAEHSSRRFSQRVMTRRPGDYDAAASLFLLGAKLLCSVALLQSLD